MTSTASPRFHRSSLASTSFAFAALLLLASGCGASPDAAVDPQPIDDDDCRADTDCGDGFECVAGLCIERPGCRVDTDCTGGATCAGDGTCQSRPIPPPPAPMSFGPLKPCQRR